MSNNSRIGGMALETRSISIIGYFVSKKGLN
jgi:hypothetical protein